MNLPPELQQPPQAQPPMPSMQGEQPMPAPQAAPQDDWHPDNDEQNAAQFIDQNLNSLDDAQKALVAEHLTPEIAMIAALIGGDEEIYQALLPYTDQSVMLVPMPRDQAMQLMQQQNSPAPQAGAMPPMGQPQRPPLPAAPAPGSAPSLS